MLFSVLIPVYNVEKYLRQCVDSVLDQASALDGEDYEILLGDDGSKDDSGRICDEYASRFPDRIRVIHKENEGLLLTRRRLLREARGDWFVHLDSDDYMLPGTLGKVRDVIEKTSPDLVLAKIIYGKEDETDLSELSRLPFADGETFEEEDLHRLRTQFLYGGYMTAIYQKIARRDIVDLDTDYHQWPGVSMMEDHLQSLPLLDETRKTVFLDQPIIYYRYNPKSITKEKQYTALKNKLLSILSVLEEEKQYLERWKLTPDEIRNVSVHHARLISLRIGEMAQAVQPDTKADFRELLDTLNGSEVYRSFFDGMSTGSLGRKSWLCRRLVGLRSIALLKILYRKG